ncbi:MAG: dockerin type I domain-containing protein [Dehalococcoidia bacterium]
MRKLIIPAALALLAVTLLASGITLAARTTGGISGVAGSYPVELNLQEDICLHDQFIWGPSDPPPHNIKLTVDIGANFISISTQVQGAVIKVTSEDFSPGQEFTASGQGMVAGFQNTIVQFDGVVEGDVIIGKYAFGASDAPPNEGGLPPCGPVDPQVHHPAVYEVKPKPATPTPTPPEKLYSIIVLKLNNANNQPLPNWEFNLYAGLNCQGNAISEQETGDRGLLDFTGLEPGPYSVEEKPQAGWNVVGEECQNVQVPQGGAAGLPACPIQPDADFPQPGCDTFVSGARVIVEINANGERFPITLNGPTQITRLSKPHKVNGFDRVETEMVFMELVGASPFGDITLREDDNRTSSGLIVEQVNTAPNEMQFPANSFFNVFFEVDIPQIALNLHNEEAFRVECKIEEIPPILCFYQPPIDDPIDLLNADGVKIAKLIHGLHIPLPPNETLVVFTNQQKGTPTPTPTRTPTPAGPTATFTPTPAATNPPPNGFCEKAGQDVGFQGQVWDAQWKCQPDPPSFRFDRIDIFVGTATQDPPKLDLQHPPLFRCQSTQQVVIGILKGTKKNVNPGTNLPHREVWSADFDGKCENGVDVYLQTTDPTNNAVIQAVAFTNSSGATATPTPCAGATGPCTPTPTPRPPGSGDTDKSGTVNAIDAALILQSAVGLTTLLHPDNADVNRDGNVNPVDASLVLQRVAGLIPSLPV